MTLSDSHGMARPHLPLQVLKIALAQEIHKVWSVTTAGLE